LSLLVEYIAEEYLTKQLWCNFDDDHSELFSVMSNSIEPVGALAAVNELLIAKYCQIDEVAHFGKPINEKFCMPSNGLRCNDSPGPIGKVVRSGLHGDN